ncbi:DUF2750 domain-containing protein [Flavobacterium branchiarum]|uniref:DUF2750 domain-containing protein n=1 Tax=Flavobacterium branchiarum TaxID=1114870 RepID=A0ABV5FK10_9FLAO|nr:DUF2750 domain-containing protein [Flavobacterium branchiarum]MDN3672426.1 DUF2750 domain-containing protein [Flavobacterium branchiarum]
MDTNKKIENILKLSKKDKYDYFIRKVVDFQLIWGLNNDGWALLGDDLDNQIFPFWPEKELAELCAVDKWSGYNAESIDLNLFLEKWIPGMEKDNIFVSIFYTPQSKGLTVSSEKLGNDINEELEEYE